MAKMKLSSASTSYSTSRTVKEEYKKLPYTDYSKYFMKAPKAPDYYKPNVLSDNQILQQSRDRVQGLYDTYIKNSSMEKDYNVGAINAAIAALNPAYENRVDALKRGYAAQERNLSNNALSKGMGRSSYLQDAKAQNTSEMGRGLSSLQMEKEQAQRELDTKRQKAELDYKMDSNKYNAQREFEVKNLVAQMVKERDKTLFDAQKYNDDLYENYSKLLLNQQKHNLNVQKYIDSIQVKKITITTTTKTTKRSTYKSDNTIDKGAIMNLWGSLSDGQKVQYAQKNSAILRNELPDLYSQFSYEASKIVAGAAFNKLKSLFR